MIAEKQENPDFKKIVPLCIKELDIKFPEYGNSWKKCNKEYWVKRMMNEVKEYELSMTVVSDKRKCLNIINMAAMAFATAGTNE